MRTSPAIRSLAHAAAKSLAVLSLSFAFLLTGFTAAANAQDAPAGQDSSVTSRVATGARAALRKCRALPKPDRAACRRQAQLALGVNGNIRIPAGGSVGNQDGVLGLLMREDSKPKARN